MAAEQELRDIALSVVQAKWNDSESPDYRPSAETFALWVGYAKRLAQAHFDLLGRLATLESDVEALRQLAKQDDLYDSTYNDYKRDDEGADPGGR